MARHLLSFLGTFPYKETNYQYGKDTHQSRYVLDALLHTACKGWGQGDKVTVFVTQQAREKNWEDHTIKKPETEETEFQEGLKSVLEKMYSEIKPEDKPDIKAADIPDGNTESEIWELFAKMNDEIKEGDELYIDITNSFREIPLLMTATAIFARSVKQAKVQAIYYGAFVPGSPDSTQIINLVKFVDIIDWSVATQLFVKHGNVDMIDNLYQTMKTSADEQQERQPAGLADMLRHLQAVVRALDNSQGNVSQKKQADKNDAKQTKQADKNDAEQAEQPDADKKQSKKTTSVLESYEEYVKNKKIYDTYCDGKGGEENNPNGGNEAEKMNANAAIREVMNVIDKDMHRFAPMNNLTSDEQRYKSFLFGMQAVKWYIQKGKVQTGFTALDETMKTYICNRYYLDETSYTDREEGCQRVCKLLSNLKVGKDDAGKTEDITEQTENGNKTKTNEEIREDAIRKWKIENPNPDTEDDRQRKRLDDFRNGHSEQEWEAYQLLFEVTNGKTKAEAVFNGISSEFVKLKLKVSESRNSMNHFGFTTKKAGTDAMTDLIGYFNKLCDITRNELKDEFQQETLDALEKQWELATIAENQGTLKSQEAEN